MANPTLFDIIILGGGAAGLMCAIEAGKRGRKALVLDHAKAPAEKIRISGGGRSNFTNLHCGPKNFLSDNPNFCKSALRGYTQHDFIDLVRKHKIEFHEKTLGQLFCDHSAKDIIEMLLVELAATKGDLWLQTDISAVTKNESGFIVDTSAGQLTCEKLVIATGGKSIPKMGATGFGYQIAEQFSIPIIEPRPALVPFTYPSVMTESWALMSGVALNVHAKVKKTVFDEAMLITHRGLSGPAILQISSYWREGQNVMINFLPSENIESILVRERIDHPQKKVGQILADFMPKRFASHLAHRLGLTDTRLAELSKTAMQKLIANVHNFEFTPGGTEGYRTAEVTLGGIDTRHLSQKTMEANSVEGLYFIGEVVDVTGHLGGHNFQWAWSSGVAAGRAV